MKRIASYLLSIVLLGLLITLVTKYYLVLISICVAYVLIIFMVNHIYKRATGKDMTIYTRMMEAI